MICRETEHILLIRYNIPFTILQVAKVPQYTVQATIHGKERCLLLMPVGTIATGKS